VKRVTVFTDSQATLTRIQLDEPGAGQVLALQKMNLEIQLIQTDIQLGYWWVHSHKGIERNQQGDLQATKAAYKHQG
jgi:hypothetical protein